MKNLHRPRYWAFQRLASQQGAVLVFSLLILLVITVVGVGMVQQNRTQFMMAENTQMQTTAFANAENLLRAAENFIANQRYVTWPLPEPLPSECVGQPCPTYHCKTPGGIFQQLLPGDLGGGAVLGAVLGMDLPDALGSNVEITRTVCLSFAAVGQQTEDCSGTPPLAFCAASLGNNQCHTEVYTVLATVVDTAHNRRTLESSYAVRCDN